MRLQTVIVTLIALGMGLAAALGVRSMRKSPEVVAVEMVPVVVAAADLERGVRLDASILEVRQVPRGQEPLAGLATVEAAAARTVKVPMLKGDPILEGKLYEKESGVGLAAMLRPGMRAFTIQCPTLSATVGGFLLPGDHVDVMLTAADLFPPASEAAKEEPASILLLEDVEVLAVHTNLEAPDTNQFTTPDRLASVTLTVTPDEALMLDLGQNKGTLHVSLRNTKKPTPGSKPDPPAAVAAAKPSVDEPGGGKAEVRPLSTPEPAPVAKSELPAEFPAARRVMRLEGLIRQPPKQAEPPPPSRPLASSRLAAGRVAATIPLPADGAMLAGMAVPGDRIDVYLALKDKQSVTAVNTLVEDAEIIAVDVETRPPGASAASPTAPAPNAPGSPPAAADGGGAGDAHYLTLAVGPEEAAMLALAPSLGDLKVVLRNRDDDGVRHRAPIGPADVLSRVTNVRVVATPPAVLPVRTLRGTAAGRDEVKIPGSIRAVPAPFRPTPRQAVSPAPGKPGGGGVAAEGGEVADAGRSAS